MQVAMSGGGASPESAFVGQGALPSAQEYASQSFPPLMPGQTDGGVATLTRVADDPATWGKVGRNEPCPCGSGKKFKHCHGQIA